MCLRSTKPRLLGRCCVCPVWTKVRKYKELLKVQVLYRKKPERKRKNLIHLGVPKGKACACSRTRKGGWAIAQSPILTTTITLERLGKRGYECMNDYYEKVSPMFNEPLYLDKVGTQWCERLSLPCSAWWGRLLDYGLVSFGCHWSNFECHSESDMVANFFI